jgi:O-antigen/teichoic acid export membrane protein
VIGTVLGAGVTTTAALILMFRACDAGSWRPSLDGLKKQVFFSVPLGMATLIGTVSKSLDQVMVASICAPAAFAVYVNGAMQIPLIGVINSSTASVLMVDYARFYKEGRISELLALIHRAMVKCALLIFPVMSFSMCMAPELMCLIFGAPYKDSAIPFRLYLLMLPARILSFSVVLQATGYSRKMLFYSMISLVSNSLLLWAAIRFLGYLLAPIGPIVSLYGLGLPYLMFTLRSILKCSISALFPWRELAKTIVASCLALPALLAVKYFGAHWPGAVVLAMGGAVYGAITLGGFFALGWGDVVPWRNALRKPAMR